MKTIVVLQARTNSSRLPAKVLLPLGDLPLVVLVARRAANSGLRVLVATSNEPDDDFLADLLVRHGIESYRGSLQDTLGRFVEALDGCDDATAVVRLTADNPLPDGRFIDEVVADFHARGLEYLACNGPRSGVPYGLSVEVFRLSRLREAGRGTSDPRDREHVTPYVVRSCGESWFDKYASLENGHFRGTIDNYDDYQSLLHVFADEPDPINVPALELAARLKNAPYQPIERAPVPKLVVGGAQLGAPYGIANRSGRPTPSLAAAMLKCAIANGSSFIDTAQAYANSEATIGGALVGGWAERVQIVTKLDPLDDLRPSCDVAVIRARVDASVFASCSRLRRTPLDVLFLHRASHLTTWGGAAWNRLRELRKEGAITALGVSVQSPDELELALGFDQVTAIQLPYNLLDWRWDAALLKLCDERNRRSITVHVRSALLQGLLVSDEPVHWRRAHVTDAGAVQQWLAQQVQRCGRAGIADLCLAFVRSQPWVDGVVVGMESLDQVRDNVRYFVAPELTSDELATIRAERPRLSPDSLDPSCWSRA